MRAKKNILGSRADVRLTGDKVKVEAHIMRLTGLRDRLPVVIGAWMTVYEAKFRHGDIKALAEWSMLKIGEGPGEGLAYELHCIQREGTVKIVIDMEG